MRDSGAKGRQRGGEAGRVSSDAAAVARSRVQDLAKRLGNEEITHRIEQGKATRQEMLAFVLQQLESARDLQQKEISLSRKDASYDWLRLAGNGVKPPDPTRWKESARVWQQAVDAICRGDLARGQKLVEQAVTLQQETIDDMTTLVDRSEVGDTPDPSELGRLVALAPTTGVCDEPLPIRDLLGAIDRVELKPQRAPDDRNAVPQWWEEEEEEEEEGEEDPDGAGGGGAA